MVYILGIACIFGIIALISSIREMINFHKKNK
jgi:hypothetical protein